MSLGTKYFPTSPEEGVQVTDFDHCLHIVMVIGKRTDVNRGLFRGGESRVTWEDLSMEEFIMREENFHEGGTGFSSIV